METTSITTNPFPMTSLPETAGAPPADVPPSAGIISSPPCPISADTRKAWVRFASMPDNAYLLLGEVAMLLRCKKKTLERRAEDFPAVFGRVKIAGRLCYLKYQINIMALYLEGRVSREWATVTMQRKTEERIHAMEPESIRNRRARK